MSEHPANSRYQNALSRVMADRWLKAQRFDLSKTAHERRVRIPEFGGTFILDAWHPDGVALEVSTAFDVHSGRFRKLSTVILKLRLAAVLLHETGQPPTRAVLLLPDRDGVISAFKEKWPYAAATRIDVEIETIWLGDEEYSDLGLVRAAQATGQARAPVNLPPADTG